jgi:preprotein translocase subunit SecG
MISQVNNAAFIESLSAGVSVEKKLSKTSYVIAGLLIVAAIACLYFASQNDQLRKINAALSNESQETTPDNNAE